MKTLALGQQRKGLPLSYALLLSDWMLEGVGEGEIAEGALQNGVLWEQHHLLHVDSIKQPSEGGERSSRWPQDR